MIVDQAQALAGGMQLVPDLGAIQARNQQLELQRMAIEQRNAAAKQEFLQMQQEQAQQAAWQQTVADLERDPRPENIRAAMLRFPRMSETLTAAFQDIGQGDLRQIGALYSYLERGDRDGAIATLEQRIAADTAAGQPDPEDQAALDALRSNDPAAVNRLRVQLGVVIANHPNGDKFTQNLGRLNGGGAEPTEFERRAEYIRRTEGEAAYRLFLRNEYDPQRITQPGGVVGRASAFDGLNGEGGDPASGGGGGNPAPAAQGELRPMSAQQAATILAAFNGDRARFDRYIREQGFVVEGETVTVRSVQQANALPPGTRYRTPDGQEYIR